MDQWQTGQVQCLLYARAAKQILTNLLLLLLLLLFHRLTESFFTKKTWSKPMPTTDKRRCAGLRSLDTRSCCTHSSHTDLVSKIWRFPTILGDLTAHTHTHNVSASIDTSSWIPHLLDDLRKTFHQRPTNIVLLLLLLLLFFMHIQQQQQVQPPPPPQRASWI